ncbi:ATP-binding protein [Streptomyces sp. NRRL F-5123]|uniref:ATP-binding protein n=1 Tax=Streptomyces sp. NRRL F-5123 TaxID=1463856 RepID=UPI00099D2FF8|nr:ATP-binding protein [Streptomyces sp. NRRL F-5123]
MPTRQLVGGAVLAALLGWLVWTVLYNAYLGTWWMWPLELVMPDDWLHGGAGDVGTPLIFYTYYALVAALIAYVAGRAGHWPELWRRFGAPLLVSESEPPLAPGSDPAAWPELRAAGAGAAADRLAGDAAAGVMSDVDYARLQRAWSAAVATRQPEAIQSFVRIVADDGAHAFLHPSGERDLPARHAHHDLVTGQVRLGTVPDMPKNAYGHRTSGLAVGPDVLGTGLLALGPSGSGKTARVLRPVAEALCLQALAGQAAVVVVGPAGADLGPDGQYDVVIRLGDPSSQYDLDLYGGAPDADTAAGVLADTLVGDHADDRGETVRRGAAALAQLLGPWRAARRRFPSVPELRQLLEGDPVVLSGLRGALEAAGHGAMLRELDARERAAAAAGDVAVLLADRVAVLDRPAFAGFFDTGQGRPFSMQALGHPIRVRITLPDRGQYAVSELLTRLVVAQFVAAVPRRRDTALFAALVVDDASRAVTAATVEGMHRLAPANAGIALALRTLDDVPPQLRTQLLAAAGCRVAMPGLPPADGRLLAEIWGTQWTQTQDVTDRQAVSDGAFGRGVQLLRKAVTGQAPTVRSVTVREVERERWSASELAHSVPANHAVISLTSRSGERTPPLLVDLRS